jgi:hypothetical protein
MGEERAFLGGNFVCFDRWHCELCHSRGLAAWRNRDFSSLLNATVSQSREAAEAQGDSSPLTLGQGDFPRIRDLRADQYERDNLLVRYFNKRMPPP